MRLAGWRRAFVGEVAGVADSERGVEGCLVVVWEAWVMLEVVRVSVTLLRLRVEDEDMLLSLELTTLSRVDGSSSCVPLTSSSCVIADAPAAAPSCVNRRSSRIWLDRVLRGDVARAAIRRVVS